MKTLILLISAALLVAAPANLSILKLSDGADAPAIDGVLNEWHESHQVAVIESDDNVYARDATDPLDVTTDWNATLYAAWDDTWVYFGIRVTVDDDSKTGYNDYEGDCMKINPGGQAMAFYMWNNTLPSSEGRGNPYLNPSCPFNHGTDLLCGVVPSGLDNPLPTYEFAIQKVMLDPFGMGMFQLSVGTEETDGAGTNDQAYLAFGAEYTGFKQDWAGNPWNNPQYYPTYTLSPTSAVEKSGPAITNDIVLTASPNPFSSGTKMNVNREKGKFDIFTVDGKNIYSRTLRHSSFDIHHSAFPTPGVYIGRLVSGKTIRTIKLFHAE